MRQRRPLWVERVVERIFEEVDERGGVDVSKATQSSGEVCWVVM